MHRRYIETFEVHLCRRGRWTVDRVGLPADKARELGLAAFRRADVEGLRIVCSRESRISGSVAEVLVVEKSRSMPSAAAVVGAVDDVQPCAALEDLLRPAARTTMHRLFQGWLRSHELGVAEVLVSTKPLRLLLDNSALIRTALHHVSALQSADGATPSAARDRLTALIGQVQAAAGGLEAWMLETTYGQPERLRRLLDAPPADAGTWRICAVIAAYLSPRPSRLAKVETLLRVLDDVDSPAVVDLLDMFLADYLLDDETALELAGPIGFLSDQLLWLAGTALGILADSRARPGPRHGFADTLPALAAAGRIPRSCGALLQAIETVLRRDAAINDGTPGREQKAVLELVQCLAADTGFAGGPRLAARLAERYAAATRATTENSFLDAVDTIVLGLSDVQVQARFLMALLNAPTDARTQSGVLTIADRAFTLYGGLKRAARRAVSARHAVAAIDGVCRVIDQTFIEAPIRETWLATAARILDKSLLARIESGELSIRELLEIAESGTVRTEAVRQALVRRLSQAAGIVTGPVSRSPDPARG